MKLNRNNFYFYFLVLLAAFTRFLFLDNKPIHHDEAINGWFVLQMQGTGFFTYNPENYHGPFLFYIFYFLNALFGKSLEIMRAATSFTSFLSIVLFMGWARNKLKRYEWVTLAWCLSPAFVFFSRSAIHESIFVLFQILFFIGLVDFLQHFQRRSYWMMCVGLFGMATNKETFVITVFCALTSVVWSLWQNRQKIWQLKNDLFSDAVLTIVLILLVFAGFGRHWGGALDFFRAIVPWMKTGTGPSGHEKDFFYWLNLMAKNEWPAVLGMIAALWGLWQKDAVYKQFSIFALLNFLIYSAIPYKTPWCLISIQWAFYFTLAFWLHHFAKGRILAYSTGLLALGNIPILYELNYRNPIELNHKYVYVQSTYDLKTIENILRPHQDQKVIISCEEGWPFPFVFSDFKKLHYTRPPDVAEDFAALLIDHGKFSWMEKKLQKKYWMATMSIRDSREDAILLLNQEIFSKPSDPRFEQWQGAVQQ